MSDQIISKIRKLQAKAQGTNNEAEAAAFAAKVQQMLLEHNLDASELDKPTEVEFDIEDMGANRTGKHWRASLAYATARYYMCAMYSSGHRGNKAIFYVTGKAHNRAIAISMYDYLVKTVRRLANEHARAVAKDYADNLAEYRSMGIDYPKEPPNLKMLRGDFDKGCCLALADRLDKLRREMIDRKPTKQDPDNKLPALFKNEQQLATEFMHQRVPNLGHRQSRGIKEKGGAMNAGRAAAKNISLNNQLRGSSTSGRLLS